MKAQQKKKAAHGELCWALPSVEASATALKQVFHSRTNSNAPYIDLKDPRATTSTAVVHASLKFRLHCNKNYFKG